MTRRRRLVLALVSTVMEIVLLIAVAFTAHKAWETIEAASSWTWSGAGWGIGFGLAAAIFSDRRQATRTHFKELRRTR